MLYPLSYGGVTQTGSVWGSAQASAIRLIHVARPPNLPTQSRPGRRTASSQLRGSDKAFACVRIMKASPSGKGLVSHRAKPISNRTAPPGLGFERSHRGE